MYFPLPARCQRIHAGARRSPCATSGSPAHYQRQRSRDCDRSEQNEQGDGRRACAQCLEEVVKQHGSQTRPIGRDRKVAPAPGQGRSTPRREHPRPLRRGVRARAGARYEFHRPRHVGGSGGDAGRPFAFARDPMRYASPGSACGVPSLFSRSRSKAWSSDSACSRTQGRAAIVRIAQVDGAYERFEGEFLPGAPRLVLPTIRHDEGCRRAYESTAASLSAGGRSH